VSAETLLVQAGLLEGEEVDIDKPSVEDALRADDRLTPEQRDAILAVYRSYIAQNTDD
jgi:hypothetical protein